MFDVTIVTQAFLYRRKPRRHAVMSRAAEEEGRALLSGDIVHPPYHTSETRGRTRTGSLTS